MKNPLSDLTDLKGLHFYADGLEFPIAIIEKNDWDRTQLNYLSAKVHTTETLIRWCRAHNMDYRIMYPLHISSIFKHPVKYFHYRKLLHSIG